MDRGSCRAAAGTARRGGEACGGNDDGGNDRGNDDGGNGTGGGSRTGGRDCGGCVADGVSAQRTAAESSQPAAEPAANTAGERPATRSKAGVSARTAYYDEPLTAYKPPRRKTSLSAFAAGGVSGASGGNGAAPWMYSSVTNDVSSIVGNGDNLSLMVRNDYNENSFRHHQPLSFGLTVRKSSPTGSRSKAA
ncbi:MAG: hypothetical protein V8Q54_06420 [Alistipes senegalensis]